jgi:hypothetical protein
MTLIEKIPVNKVGNMKKGAFVAYCKALYQHLCVGTQEKDD